LKELAIYEQAQKAALESIPPLETELEESDLYSTPRINLSTTEILVVRWQRFKWKLDVTNIASKRHKTRLYVYYHLVGL
jgi:hypothetical protein